MNETKEERRKKTINRIHRIQGQLAALEQSIQANKPCKDLVIQARTVEKATASLISHMFEGFLLHQYKDIMHTDRDQAIQEISGLFKLINQ
jgi:DNA-binding FrmR family transcriptional regulator